MSSEGKADQPPDEEELFGPLPGTPPPDLPPEEENFDLEQPGEQPQSEPISPKVIRKAKHKKRVLNLLTGPPGLGKSEYVLDSKEYQAREGKDIKTIYLSHSNEILDEIEKRAHEKGIMLCRWRGLASFDSEGAYLGYCPRYWTDEFIMYLIENKAAPAIVCRLCDENHKTCPYHAQFKTKEKFVIGPIHFLTTKLVKAWHPKEMIVDDATLLTHDLPSWASMENWQQALLKYGIIMPNETIMDYADAYTNRELIGNIANYISTCQNNGTKPDNGVLFINPYDIINWLTVITKVGHRKEFALPYLRDIILHCKNTRCKITIVDAIDMSVLIDKVAETMEGREIAIQVLAVDYPTEANFLWYLYQVHDMHAIPRVFTHQTIRQEIETLAKRIAVITRPVQRKKVGIITWLDCVDKYFDALGMNGVNVTESAHFGNIRGSNRLQFCDILFLIGTYCLPPDNILEKFEEFYLRSPKSIESKKVEGEGYEWQDPELESFSKFFNDAETYQEIHRIRPFLHEVAIYVFGAIPDWIMRETTLSHIYIDKDYRLRDVPDPVDVWLEGYLRKNGVTKQGELVLLICGIYNTTRPETARELLTSAIDSCPGKFSVTRDPGALGGVKIIGLK